VPSGGGSLRFLLSRRWLLLLLVVLLFGYACLLLGRWQWHRLESKKTNNAIIRANEDAAPVPVEQVLREGRNPDSTQQYAVVSATGTGERDAAASLIAALPRRRVTIGGDKGYDTRGFVEMLRTLEATPHVAVKKNSRTLDRRTTRHPGYAISQCARKRIEEVFGWMKTVGGLRKLRHRGGGRVNWQFLLAAAAYNMVRMRTLETTA